MGIAVLLERKNFIPDKSVCIETSWFRIPSADTPHCNLVRKYVLELIDYDPLSRKVTTIYSATGNKVKRSRHGVQITIAIATHKDGTTKEGLIAIHKRLVYEVEEKGLPEEPGEAGLDGWLREFIKDVKEDSRRQD